MSTPQLTYTVAGMTCEHCRTAITDEVASVSGVAAVDVDLTTRHVTVTGADLDGDAVRGAIAEAGYDIA